MKSAVGKKDFRYIENSWIELSDGVRLAAALWLPADASEAKKVPAVLEVLPYRKRDLTATRDYQSHSYLAAKGFAGCRVDMRGAGDSEGLFDAHQTYADIVEVLQWLAKQPWCNGKLGMMGLSWGGINGIMAADRHAAGLKALMVSSFSTDRYSDGMLWKNACVLNRNFVWATGVVGMCSRPPDPAVVGDAWRDLWMQRLENMQPEITSYLGHQRRDAYWDKHRIEHATDITCPIFMTGGWADSNYTQTLPKLLDQTKAPMRAVFGPWGHRYPHYAVPGPGFDYLGEAVRWFGRWLRDEQNGIEKEPIVQAFISEDVPAKTFYAEAPGQWAAESQWPIPHDTKTLYLGDGKLTATAPAPSQLSYTSPQTVGLSSGELMPWFAYAPGPELPGDQRRDDGQSICFDSGALTERLVTLGVPELDLEFSVDRPAAFLAIRICDVKPDGTSVRVNLGLHNLTRMEGDRNPTPLTPGRRYRFKLPLDFKGYAFKAGHRIRVAISTTYWPMVWPSAEPVTLTIYRGESRISLPIQKAGVQNAQVTLGHDIAIGASLNRSDLAPPVRKKWVSHDEISGETVLTVQDENGTFRLNDIDWEVSSSAEEVYGITGNDPLTARASATFGWRFKRGNLTIATETKSSLRCTKTAFHCELSLKASENGSPVSDRTWTFEFPRDLV
jgi:hypothetical protein